MAATLHVSRTSLKALLERLDPLHFGQIHRSTLVNLRCIEKTSCRAQRLVSRFRQM